MEKWKWNFRKKWNFPYVECMSNLFLATLLASYYTLYCSLVK